MATSDERLNAPSERDEKAARRTATRHVAIAEAVASDASGVSGEMSKSADQLRRESEDRFRALVEATGQLVWTIPPDGLVVDMPLWRAYTGQSVEQVRGWGWLDAVHPADRVRTRRRWAQAVATRTLYEVEYRLRRQDGVYRDFLVRAVPVLEPPPDGTLREWVGVHTDITERKRAEEARVRLLERERDARTEASRQVKQLEAVFAAMSDAVLVYDEAGYIARVNPAGSALLGLEAEPEHVTRPPEDRSVRYALRDEQGHPLTPEQSPVLRMLRGEVLMGERVMNIQLDTLDGRQVRLSYAGAPMRDDDGAITGAVGVCRDVTVQHQLQRRTHETLATLLEMAEALVNLETEESGARTGQSEPNPVAQRLAELTRQVLACKRISITSVDHETESTRTVAVTGLTAEQQQQWNAEQAAETPLSDSASPDIMARLRAGELVTLDLAQSPYRDLPNHYGTRDLLIAPMRIGERLTGFLALDYGGEPHHYTDDERALASAAAKLTAAVLEHERLLREREEARASALALQQANQRMDEFIGIAGHELRTPLTVVKANLQMFARQLNRPAKATSDRHLQQQAMLQRMDKQMERLDRLVNDLLDDSRIQEGKLQMRMERGDLAAVVREAVEEQRLAHPGRPLRLRGAAEGAVWVRGDGDRLGQVVTNYLTNALKYSAETEPVELTVERHAECVRITVRDRGPGLTPEQQAHIWKRFHRAPGIEVQSGSGVGLGLGLHISQTIVERHHGKVGLESKPGAGSAFWFELPVES